MTFTSTDLLEMADAFEATSRVYRALRQAASDREDAERYRWLRDQATPGGAPAAALRCIDGPYFNEHIAGQRLDEAIDQACQESRHG